VHHCLNQSYADVILSEGFAPCFRRIHQLRINEWVADTELSVLT